MFLFPDSTDDGVVVPSSLGGDITGVAAAIVTDLDGSSNSLASTTSKAKNNGTSRIRESLCLQNGTWTRVEMRCVRDPSVPSGGLKENLMEGGAGGGGGGYLVGGQARYDSGTMMLIAVVAAVITGTAVAFFIIFVRKW